MKTAVRPVIHHSSLTMPLEMAMQLNREMPMPGLDLLLRQIRREHGPDVLVSICPECDLVEVIP